MISWSPYTQYFAFNGIFNFTRALYISTYSLYLIEVARLPVAWMLADLLISTVVELPTGAFADMYGRRTSFLAASSLCIFGYCFYASAALPNFWIGGRFATALMGETLLSVGVAFYSGALDAWILDHPKNPKTLTLQELFALGHGIKNALYILGGVIGIAFYAAYPRIPTMYYLAAVIGIGMTIASALFMYEDIPESNGTFTSDLQLRWVQMKERMKSAVKLCLTDQNLRHLTLLSSAGVLLLQVVVVFWPYYLTFIPGTNLSTRGFFWSLSIAWIGAYGSRALGNTFAGSGLSQRRPAMAVSLAIVVNSCCLCALCLIPFLGSPQTKIQLTIIAVGLYSLVRWGEGAGESLRSSLLNALLEKEQRATVLSAVNVISLMFSSVAVSAFSIIMSCGGNVLIIFGIIGIANFLTLPASRALKHFNHQVI